MSALPTGTVTFAFTDIEGSTRLLNALGHDRFGDVLGDHRRMIREVVAESGGEEFGTEGDAFFLAFASAPAALRAAVEIQRRLAKGEGGGDRGLRIRIGMHTGEGVLREGDYVGIDVHRAARIAAAGHGGQVLLSGQTRSLVEGQIPPGVSLRDLGNHRLKDLDEPVRIHEALIDGLSSTFPPLKTLDRPAGNLPAQLTSFVGRGQELEQARLVLADTKLLTLTGPGGTGKTRLSIQLATEVRDEFDDGAWFVPLAPITDPALVPSAIAEALGLAEVRGETRPALERVVEHLRDREALLVLDNFEQILGAADAVSRILHADPAVKVVVTTREPLRMYGEREFPVPPLALPDPKHLPALEALSHYEAVALFIDRASAVKPDFAVTNENAPAVAEICARLDGLPLAIELAAARIRVLTPDGILARLGDRLALLQGGARDLPARQQTLRQAIAWSHDLLSDSERRSFARLGVFMGGWTLEDAEAVLGPAGDLGTDVLEAVESLVDKSLVVTRDAAGGARFDMLETIRAFAVERLEEDDEADVRRRHAEAYLALAEQALPHLTTRDARRWLDRLEPEHDNVRAALEWAIGRPEPKLALSLVTAMWRFWQMRGHLQEGRMWADRALSLPGVQDHPRERAEAVEAAGGLAYWQFDIDAFPLLYQDALEAAETLGDPTLIANAHYNLSFTFQQDEYSPDAAAHLEKSLELYERLGDRDGIAKVQWSSSNQDLLRSDLESARTRLSVALDLSQAVGNDFLYGWSLFQLGGIEHRDGRFDAAAAAFRDSLRIFAEVDDVTGILFNLEGLATLALGGGDAERGIKLAAAAAMLRVESGTGLTDPVEEARIKELVEGLDTAEVARIRAEGERMSRDEAVAFALQD
ncbi:MAG: adenylate/guanylate cyclase domain-containing protein [Actinomycetota bacterium]